MTRRGITVLRVDDRGVGGSTGNLANSTSEDFAGDVIAGIAYLKSRGDINAKEIGLIGHSEGALVAPLAAARSTDVAFIVMLAGTGLPGDEIMYLQGRLIGKALGADEKALARQFDMQKRIFEIIRTETDHKKTRDRLLELTKKLMSELSEDERKQAGDISAYVDSLLKSVDSPWFRFALTCDPRPILAKVRCPVLALNGAKDLQVPPRENLGEIKKALELGGNRQVTVKEIPGVNHLFQTCKTGAISEYGEIEETIAPTALTLIADWVVEQATKAHEFVPDPVRGGVRVPFFSKPLHRRALDDVSPTTGLGSLPDLGPAAEDVLPGEQSSRPSGRRPSAFDPNPGGLEGLELCRLGRIRQRVAGKVQTQVRGKSLRAGGVSLGRIDQRLQVLDFISLN